MLNLKLIKQLYPFVWYALDDSAKELELAKLISMHYLDAWLKFNNEHFEALDSTKYQPYENLSTKLKTLQKKRQKFYTQVQATFCPPFSQKTFFRNGPGDHLTSDSICEVVWSSFKEDYINIHGVMSFGPDLLNRMAQAWNYEYLVAS